MLHSRKEHRLKEYDYSQPGYYFVTICTYHKQHLFGDIVGNRVVLNTEGKIAENEWLKTPVLRPNIQLDEFIVMPNHIHGIIIINKNASTPEQHDVPFNRRGVLQYAPTRAFCSPSRSIGAIVRGYKSTVAQTSLVSHLSTSQTVTGSYIVHPI